VKMGLFDSSDDEDDPFDAPAKVSVKPPAQGLFDDDSSSDNDSDVEAAARPNLFGGSSDDADEEPTGPVAASPGPLAPAKAQAAGGLFGSGSESGGDEGSAHEPPLPLVHSPDMISAGTLRAPESAAAAGGLDESSSFLGVSVFTRPSGAADPPPTGGGGQVRRLRVGDTVTVVANPRNTDFLQPGQAGTVVEVDDMDLEDVWFSVEDGEGETDEYCEADLTLALTGGKPRTDVAAVQSESEDEVALQTAVTVVPERQVAELPAKPKKGLFDSSSDDGDDDADDLFG
jgi:hypothetical protein